MAFFEKPFDAHDQSGPSSVRLPIARTIKGAAVLAVLLAYAIGFVMLYPATRASVLKSAAEGNDSTALQFVSP